MTPLASLRLPSDEIEALRWLLHREWAGDLGVRSNLGPIIDRAERFALGGRPFLTRWTTTITVHDPASWRDLDVHDHVLEAATKLRGLERRWQVTAPTHRIVLTSAYGPDARPLKSWDPELAAIVRHSSAAAALYATARASAKPPRCDFEAWLASLRGRAQVTYERICVDAEAMLVGASRAWMATHPELVSKNRRASPAPFRRSA